MMAAVMTAITLGELLGAGAGAHAAVEISDLTLDSRSVAPGAAFVAVAGTRDHGLAYAADALTRGAAVVLYEPDVRAAPPPGDDVRLLAVTDLRSRLGGLARRFFWRDSPLPALFGVTGTNGKTTVAWLVAQAMQGLGRDCAYVGTLGYGRPPAPASHPLTTPDCLTLHRELAGLGAAAAAIELSSHGLVQGRAAGLDFAAAAVTNLSRDHLDAHGSMADYARAKARILDLPGLRTVVLNADDEFAAGLAAAVPAGVRALRVSRRRGAAADIVADVTGHGFGGIAIEAHHAGRQAVCRSPLIGDFNAENLLVALGLLVGAGGVELGPACDALAACQAAPGRLEVFRRADGAHVVVDYAHTPAALERTLAVIDGLGAGRTICVFGCGGDRDRGKRALMGRAASAASRLVLTDDNPRGEPPADIVADILTGVISGRPVVIEHDRERAIRLAIETAGPDDIVLVAGKGHETTQTVGDAVRVLDDRAIVRAALVAGTGTAS